jgi:transcriptional regulator GlxA family with amidase domain
MTRNVAILIFDEVEVLDFCGPFEVFGVTGLRNEGERPFHVYTVAESAGPVIARNGLSVNPNFTIENCPTPDLLLVPGGYGTRKQIHNSTLVNWVKDQAEHVELLLSVCTGAFILAKAGLLDGLRATTLIRNSVLQSVMWIMGRLFSLPEYRRESICRSMWCRDYLARSKQQKPLTICSMCIGQRQSS